MYTTTSADNPRGTEALLRLWRAPKLGKMTVRFASAVIGLLTHRPKSADMPCSGAECCPPALHRGRSRWKGYACVYGWRDSPYRDWIPGVVEITERLDAVMPIEGCVGQAWEIWREPGESGHVEVTGMYLDTATVPNVADPMSWIEPVLSVVYRVSSLNLGVANPFRSRVKMSPLVMAPPPNAAPPVEERKEAERAETKKAAELLREARAAGRV